MESLDSKAVWPGWETVRLIGRGSFGAVYEIQRDIFGNKEKAALKVISIPQHEGDIEEMYSDGYDNESITATFQSHLQSIVNEYSLMRKLNGSANVVNCDDVRYVKHTDGIGWDIYIKMELLTPLTKALPEEIPDEQVIAIGRDICRALVLCRKYDIIHRDIKPQNIFVSDLGDYKLGDFGIAKTVEKTSGGTKIGTYKYMAPEVYNNRPYGPGADIYSLGLVLYWLLNERRMPFLPLPPEKLRAGMEEEARLRRFKGEAIPAPAHGSNALKDIVLKACAYRQEDRYQSAAEMLSDLEALSAPTVTEKPFAPGKTREIPVVPDDRTTLITEEIDEPTFRGQKNVPPVWTPPVRPVPDFGTVPPRSEDYTSVMEDEGTSYMGYTGDEEGTAVIPGDDGDRTTVIRDGWGNAAEIHQDGQRVYTDHFAERETESKRKKFIFAGIGGAAVLLILVIALLAGRGGSGKKPSTNSSTIGKAPAAATAAPATAAPEKTAPATARPAAAPAGNSITLDVNGDVTLVATGDSQYGNQVKSVEITGSGNYAGKDSYTFEYNENGSIVWIDHQADGKWLASWDISYGADKKIKSIVVYPSDGTSFQMDPSDKDYVIVYRETDGTGRTCMLDDDWGPIFQRNAILQDATQIYYDYSFNLTMSSVGDYDEVGMIGFDNTGHMVSLDSDTAANYSSDPVTVRTDHYDGSLQYVGYRLYTSAENYTRFTEYDANGNIIDDRTYDSDWNLIDGPESAGKTTPAPTAAPTPTPASNYIARLDGYWSNDRILLSGRTNTYGYMLNEPVKNCTQLTMNIHIDVNSGSPNGWWSLYIRKLDGQWYQIKDFLVDSSYTDGTKQVVVTFSTPTSFDGFATAAQFYGSYSISTSLSFTDVYLK